jgi:hypothetical protein
MPEPVGEVPQDDRRRSGSARRDPRPRSRSSQRERTAAATSSTSSSVSVRQSRRVRPSRTSATTGGRRAAVPPRACSSTAQAALGSSASGSAPPADTRNRSPRPRRRRARRAARRGRAPPRPARRASRRTGTESRDSGPSANVPSSACERELVCPERALQRMAAQSAPPSSARPTTTPACGPPRSLSPREADEVGACAEGSPQASARRRCRASEPEPRSSTSGSVVAPSDVGEIRQRRPLEKPTTRKFD